VKSSLNGNRRLAEEAAIRAAWDWFVDTKFQATAVEVLKFVRARAPGVSSERVRVAFKERLRAGVWRSGNQRSGSVVSQQ